MITSETITLWWPLCTNHCVTTPVCQPLCANNCVTTVWLLCDNHCVTRSLFSELQKCDLFDKMSTINNNKRQQTTSKMGLWGCAADKQPKNLWFNIHTSFSLYLSILMATASNFVIPFLCSGSLYRSCTGKHFYGAENVISVGFWPVGNIEKKD